MAVVRRLFLGGMLAMLVLAGIVRLMLGMGT
jgi:hypothetical protein